MGKRAEQSTLELISYHTSSNLAKQQAQKLLDLKGLFVRLTDGIDEDKAMIESISYTIKKGKFAHTQVYDWALMVTLVVEVE